MTDGSLKLIDTARISRSYSEIHLDLALAQEGDRLLPVHDLEGLVRRVQEERLLHDAFILPDASSDVKARIPPNLLWLKRLAAV